MLLLFLERTESVVERRELLCAGADGDGLSSSSGGADGVVVPIGAQLCRRRSRQRQWRSEGGGGEGGDFGGEWRAPSRIKKRHNCSRLP